MRPALMIAVAAVLTVSAASAQEVTVRVGNAPSIASGALLIAIERGYFREVGIKIVIAPPRHGRERNRAAGAESVSGHRGWHRGRLLHALERNLPVTIAMSRVSTPLGHNMMLRADLKGEIKEIKQLKGRVIATNGPGSVSTYEIGKMLETAGLTMADVDVKVIPFAQYAIAFRNRAIDAALAIHPFTSQLRDLELAVPFADSDALIEPRPITISVNMINTDWASRNPAVARNFYLAALRGARDYCQAYHGSAVRKEMIDLLVKSGTERRPEMLHQYTWPARDRMAAWRWPAWLDMQAWYVRNKFVGTSAPAARVLDLSHIEAAAERLPPFVVENADSKLPGCR